jgi:hypothetical protein
MKRKRPKKLTKLQRRQPLKGWKRKPPPLMTYRRILSLCMKRKWRKLRQTATQSR